MTTLVDDARQRTENEEDSVLTLGVRLGGNRNTRIAELNRYFNGNQLHHWASRTECLKPKSPQYPLMIRVSHLNQVSPTIIFATPLPRAKVSAAGGGNAVTAIVVEFSRTVTG